MRRNAILVLFFALAACGGKTSYVQKATTTLNVVHESTKTADAAFVAWDKEHQLQIVASSKSQEEAKSRLAAYRAKRQSVVHAFTVVYSAIAAVAAVIPLVEKAIEPETKLAELLGEALRASLAVKAAIDQVKKE